MRGAGPVSVISVVKTGRRRLLVRRLLGVFWRRFLCLVMVRTFIRRCGSRVTVRLGCRLLLVLRRIRLLFRRRLVMVAWLCFVVCRRFV